MSENAVRRIHEDIQHLHQAQRARQHDAHALARHEKNLAIDQRHRDHERDRFKDNKKDLGKDRDQLHKLLGKEKDQLAPLKAEEQQAQAAYDASVDPATGVGDPELKAALDAIVAKASRVQARFDARVDPKRDAIQKLADRVDGQRKDLESLQREIKGDHRDVKRDRKALAKAKDRVHDRRKKARGDLEPAEYKMDLKHTNQVRKELGLKPVDHVIRPNQVNLHALPPQYRSYADAIARSAHRYHLPAAYVAAVIDRETGGRNILGDGGHGHGLMQIDDRYFGGWLASHHNGLDPRSNIDFGCHLLRENLDAAHRLGLKGHEALKFAASAYNAGLGGAENGLREYGNSDHFTTGGNYGSDVLHRMNGFKRGFGKR